MFLTTRERNIIEQVIKHPKQYTITELTNHLGVSHRTCLRDIKNIKNTLQVSNLRLEKNEKKYYISGPKDAINQLWQQLQTNITIAQTTNEIKYLLLVELSNHNKPLKLNWLASQAGISYNTARKYIAELKTWLQNFKLEIAISRGIGIQLIASEVNLCTVLTEFLLQFCYKNVTSIINDSHLLADESVFYRHLSIKNLKILERTLKEMSPQFLNEQMRLRFILQVLIFMSRLQAGLRFPSTHAKETIPISKEVETIINTTQIIIALPLNTVERNYLALLWENTTKALPKSQLLSAEELRKIAEKLIARVSAKIAYDLTTDTNLLNDLVAHLTLTIYQLEQQFVAYNPLLTDILAKYPLMYTIIADNLNELLPMFSFSRDEICYLVLHFCATLEKIAKNIKLTALIVCPTGMGTSKMLLSRIQKEFPAITHPQIELTNNITAEKISNFNLIFTTVPIAITAPNIFFVSPLLSKDNTKTIKQYISANLNNILAPPSTLVTTSNLNVEYYEQLNYIFHLQDHIKNLVTNFELNNFSDCNFTDNVNALLTKLGILQKKINFVKKINATNEFIIMHGASTNIPQSMLIIGNFLNNKVNASASNIKNNIIILFVTAPTIADNEADLVDELMHGFQKIPKTILSSINDYKQIRNEIAKLCFTYLQKKILILQ